MYTISCELIVIFSLISLYGVSSLYSTFFHQMALCAILLPVILLLIRTALSPAAYRISYSGSCFSSYLQHFYYSHGSLIYERE